MAEETTQVDAPEEEAEDSITELLEQLGREVAALVYYESRLAASRNQETLRRVARDTGAGLVAAAALMTAFVLANTTALLALATVVDPWLAALVLTAAWTVVGAALALALRARLKRATALEPTSIEEARDEAEQAVRATLERLAPTLAKEIALAAVPTAGGLVEMGDDLIEGADEIVDAITDELPGGRVVNQVWDVALAPGRLGVRVATTVLRRGRSES